MIDCLKELFKVLTGTTTNYQIISCMSCDFQITRSFLYLNFLTAIWPMAVISRSDHPSHGRW